MVRRGIKRSVSRQPLPSEIDPKGTELNLIKGHRQNRDDGNFRKLSYEPRTSSGNVGMVQWI
jgi:hypothetical protein